MIRQRRFSQSGISQVREEYLIDLIDYWKRKSKMIRPKQKQILSLGGKASQTREEYLEELAKRQKEHLDKVHQNQQIEWQPCLHDSCPNCHGTGIKLDGSICIHMISCPCPKCSPR